MPQNTSISIVWEQLSGDSRVYRAKVFNGWLVAQTKNGDPSVTESIVYIPDPCHSWQASEYNG
jgi:hypothetical protein